MQTDRFLSFSMFFFLLSVFLSAASSRSESRFSSGVSKASFALGLATAAAILFLRMRAAGAWVIPDFFGGVLVSILILGIVYAILAARFPARMDPAFFASASFLLGGMAYFRSGPDVPGGPTPPAIGGHAFFMFLSLAAFSLSFVFSVLFLVQDHLIKKKSINALSLRLPPLELTGRLNFSFLTLGTASLFAGVSAGLFYLARQGITRLFSEPTFLLSILMLALYATILTLRTGPLERGRGAAFVSIACYSLLVLTFLAAHPGAAR